MKKLSLLLFYISFLSISCSDGNSNSVIKKEILQEKKQNILKYINSFDCSGSCNYIAFGSKPCGGPREYLLYSSTVNESILQEMVNEYNLLDQQYNILTNAISDCALVLPPNLVECQNGDCKIIN